MKISETVKLRLRQKEDWFVSPCRCPRCSREYEIFFAGNKAKEPILDIANCPFCSRQFYVEKCCEEGCNKKGEQTIDTPET